MMRCRPIPFFQFCIQLFITLSCVLTTNYLVVDGKKTQIDLAATPASVTLCCTGPITVTCQTDNSHTTAPEPSYLGVCTNSVRVSTNKVRGTEASVGRLARTSLAGCPLCCAAPAGTTSALREGMMEALASDLTARVSESLSPS